MEVADEPARYVSLRPIICTVICLLGLADAGYLTYEHYTASHSLACLPIAGFNCVKVTTSAESRVFGIPVAVLGLVFFAGMLLICLPRAWRLPWRFVAEARLAGVVVGVGFICYLLYAELYEIHAICLWCTGVHILTFLLFVTIATGWDDARALREDARPEDAPL